MSAPVNLNQACKAREKAAEKAQADANAARHGRTKAQRLREAMDEARARRALDGARVEGDAGE